MITLAKPKCKVCKEEVDKTKPFEKTYKGYFHTECYAELIQQKAEEEKKKNHTNCEKCGKLLDKKDEDNTRRRGKKYYHAECFEKLIIEEYEKNKRPCEMCGQLVSPYDEDTVKAHKGYFHSDCHEKYKRQMENREKLCLYIAEKYNLAYPTGGMLKQIDEYHRNRNYSYRAMLSTFKYMFEVEKIQPKENVGIGLVTFYYEKAKKYHMNLESIANSATGISINNEVSKVKAIEPVKRKKAGYIDMDKI